MHSKFRVQKRTPGQNANMWSSATRLSKQALSWRAGSIGLTLLIFIFFMPQLTLKIITISATTIIVIMATLRLIAIGMIVFPPKQRKTTRLDDMTWPSFTVLVPLYKESRMVKSLMQNLEQLEYPRDKLNIIMVCEADDQPTCLSIRQHLRPPFDIFEVPQSLPRTKPKALNATLASLLESEKGEIITIYDAEDRPHPLQLKAAAHALNANPDMCAVQAPLGYYNAYKNPLTAFFALEYAALFQVWNPALARLGLPFTLGGTSNHIRRTVLDAVGGWDSHNVTEDADLSFRMSALAGTGLPTNIGCIEYGTQEEAVSQYPAWTHQRSRWLKGFMQTWAVHMRTKASGPTGAPFLRSARIKNAMALQITVGATLIAAFLHVPSIIILIIINIATAHDLLAFTHLPIFYGLMMFGYGTAILAAIIGAIKEKKPRLIFYSPFLLLYWLIYFHAALIAGYEFIFAPSKWRKTEHQGDIDAQNRVDSMIDSSEKFPSPLEAPSTPPI